MGAPELEQDAIPGSLLATLFCLCERRGISYHPWLAELGLAEARVRDCSQLLTYRQLTFFVRRALRALPKAPWGLVVGPADVRENLGVLGLALRSCRTVGDALRLGLQHHPAAGSFTDFAAEAFDDTFAIRTYPRERDSEIEQFLVECALASFVTTVRSVSSPTFAPSRVELAFPESSHLASYRKFFQCPVLFGMAANRACMPQSFLSEPIKSANTRQLKLALLALEGRVETPESSTDLLSAVREQLEQNLRGSPTMAQVAERLHMTERTLRRHLATGGHRFSALHDEARAERALELLRSTSASIKAIAVEVGYRSDSELRRAVRRWTGQAPRAVRNGQELPAR